MTPARRFVSRDRDTSARARRSPGRPSAASPDDVLRAATRLYLRGEAVDVKAIAASLGVGRATVYRWFGSRERLIGRMLIGLVDRIGAAARKGTRGKGAAGLLTAFNRYNRAVAGPALRAFIEHEGKVGLRIIASGGGLVQPHVVAMVTRSIEEEVEAGTYAPATEPATLAYAIVRLGEAFLFNDAVAGMRGDVDRLRDVQAALLGVAARHRKRARR